MGIRDITLLQSAIGMPMSEFGRNFLHDDLFEMSAAYLFHIANNHPFLDGNKRVGAVAAVVFLAMNDIELDADPAEFEAFVLDVVAGKIGKKEIASFFRKNI